MARIIAVATREHGDGVEWRRVGRTRIKSSRFGEICHVSGQSSAKHLALGIGNGGAQTAVMKRRLASEPVAVRGHHPMVLRLTPTESPPFGLLEIECLNAKSCVDCSDGKMQSDTMKLKRRHG
ncbi:hypothetical protein N1851_029172 [Merluccius polli]|uniref:Uncharacterized protein n=1 Tax=Merluccius polli TaxID=89951 RepID=A0AA47NQX8_MERPO|nr:hypothetical protein N1851_029172 [Merluccius polli]